MLLSDLMDAAKYRQSEPDRNILLDFDLFRGYISESLKDYCVTAEGKNIAWRWLRDARAFLRSNEPATQSWQDPLQAIAQVIIAAKLLRGV